MSEPKTIRVLGSGGDYEDWPNPNYKEPSSFAPATGSAFDTFGGGVVSMARSCQAAMKLVRSGQWSINQVELWLTAVINNDADYVLKAVEEIAQNTD